MLTSSRHGNSRSWHEESSNRTPRKRGKLNVSTEPGQAQSR
jgi:hypothetical protein